MSDFRHSDQVIAAAAAARFNYALSDAEARFFMALALHVNATTLEAFPGIGLLMEQTGLSRSGLYKARDGLVQLGLITMVRRGRPLTWRLNVGTEPPARARFGSLSTPVDKVSEDLSTPVDKKVHGGGQFVPRGWTRTYDDLNTTPLKSPADSPAADAASSFAPERMADLAEVRAFASKRFAELRAAGVAASEAHGLIASEVTEQLGTRPNSRPQGKPWTASAIRGLTTSARVRDLTSKLVERWQELRAGAGLPREQGTEQGAAQLAKIFAKLDVAHLDSAAARVEQAMVGLLADSWVRSNGHARLAFLARPEKIKQYRSARPGRAPTTGMIQDSPDATKVTAADAPIAGGWS